jgi:hypothetical protein
VLFRPAPAERVLARFLPRRGAVVRLLPVHPGCVPSMLRAKMYHVTFTTSVKSIRKFGLQRGMS